MKLFTKKQFFAFLASFTATLVAGYFVWNLFSITNNYNLFFNQVLWQASGTGAKTLEPAVELTKVEVQPEEIASSPSAPRNDELTSEQRQDILDDIQEKLDIIAVQVKELQDQQNPQIKPQEEEQKDEQKEDLDDETDEDIKNEEQNVESSAEAIVCTGQININTASDKDLDKLTGVGPATAQKIISARPFYSLDDLLKVSGIGPATLQKIKDQNCAYVEPSGGGGGGGGSAPTPEPITYPKILISEVQVAGATADDEFIELYNPNNVAVDLADFSLKKKNSSGEESNLVSLGNLLGTVSPSDYFLIVPQKNDDGSEKYTDSAIPDARYSGKSYYISAGNTILLYNKNGEISDEMGFGEVDKNKSFGRKVLEDKTEKDTDNNNADFEIQKPTPKAVNERYSAPTLMGIAITTPATKLVYTVGDQLDIAGLVITGTYSDNTVKIETVASYNITGFDSSAPIIGQILTITINGQTATYIVDIKEAGDTTTPSIIAYTLNGSAQNVSFNPHTASSVSIVITASEPVDWVSAKIYKSDDDTIYKNKSPINNGDSTNTTVMTWDGTLTKPTVGLISDGTYLIKVHIKDLTGNNADNIILSSYTITVNTTDATPNP